MEDTTKIFIGVALVVIVGSIFLVMSATEKDVVVYEVPDYFEQTNAIRVNTMTCIELNTSNPEWAQRNIAIDPSHGGDLGNYYDGVEGDPGIIVGTKQEADMMLVAARFIGQELSNAVLTRDEDVYMSEDQRAEKVQLQNPIAVIRLSSNQGLAKDENQIIARVSSNRLLESRKLGCILINNLVESMEDVTATGILIVDDNKVLNSVNAPGVELELGNMANPQGIDNIQMVSAIANAVKDSLEEYYE